MKSGRQTSSENQCNLESHWLASTMGILVSAMLVLGLLINQVTATELTHEQLFKFGPLPDGALPDEYLYTPGIRECVFQVIRKNLLSMVLKDERINAKFLRLIFHDCAAGGCNGSIMRDEEHNGTANEFLTGFDEIRTVRAAIDRTCNVSISFADTIIAGGVEGVKETGGPDITSYVRFGRRDTESHDDPNKLPLPFVSTDELIRVFAPLGLNVEDLVALSGAHTIGKATCKNIVARLGSDPTADPAFLFSLLPRCTALATQQLDLDAKTPEVFDKYYFQVLMEKKAMLQTDQGLYDSESTHPYVLEFVANQTNFFRRFQAGLLKLSMVGVIDGPMLPAGDIHANVNFSVPIEASVTLFRPAALVRNNIYGLQAQLNQQLATPNTSAIVTSIKDHPSEPGQCLVHVWIVPLPLYHHRTSIPYDELMNVLVGLNQTAHDPSRLLLDDTLFGTPQSFEVVSFPINTPFPVPGQSSDAAAYVTELLPFANFTLEKNPASQQGLFRSQITTILRVRPSETLEVSLQTPSEAQTVVTLLLRQTGSVTFAAARLAELEQHAAQALDQGTLFSPTVFGVAEGSRAAREQAHSPEVGISPSPVENDTSIKQDDPSALRDAASGQMGEHSGTREVNFTFGIMAAFVGVGGLVGFLLHRRAVRATTPKTAEQRDEGEQAPLRQATELEDRSVAQNEAGDDIASAIGGSYEASASPRARAR